MAFKIGDKVVHPEYGPGVIRALCQPGPGEPGREELVIVIPHRHTEIRVPCADLERIGLRRLIHVDELLSVSATMLRQPEPLTIDLPARQALLHRRGRVFEPAYGGLPPDAPSLRGNGVCWLFIHAFVLV
jgi:RNA polymerase-interacting CarD/CdnL/TRCF family regulator